MNQVEPPLAAQRRKKREGLAQLIGGRSVVIRLINRHPPGVDQRGLQAKCLTWTLGQTDPHRQSAPKTRSAPWIGSHGWICFRLCRVSMRQTCHDFWCRMLIPPCRPMAKSQAWGDRSASRMPGERCLLSLYGAQFSESQLAARHLGQCSFKT